MEGWRWEDWIPHLEELRVRLIRAIIVYLLAVAIMWFFHSQIMDFISKPVGELYLFNVQDPFFVRLKVAFMAALFFTFPYFLWEIWRFVEPALYPHEKRAAALVLLSALILFYGGALMSIFVIIPRAVKFLLSFSEGFTTMVNANQYLNFVFWSTVIFGVVFELPVAVGILAKLGIVRSRLLQRRRREIIVAIVILTAVISPTVDMFSLLLMSLPLIALFEVSIWVAKTLEPKEKG
ncbi:MAG: twin-arginine translocase subunit TatC [Thermotogae bacterium]|nr:twin-arginine translocase subunit TatC [Thermotogota bacterium]